MTRNGQPAPGLFVRAFNTVAAAGEPLGICVPHPDGDRLTDRINRNAPRFVDERVREFAKSALASARETGGLTPLGRWAARTFMMRSLRNAQAIDDYVERHRGVLDTPVERPILIVGWYRSGTTLLHRLLCSAEGVRIPRAYELYFPVPQFRNPSASATIQRLRMRNMLWLAHLAIPELRFLHRIEVDSPEESTVLLDNAGLGVYFLHAFGAHRHGWHLAGSDLSRAFQSMRVQLQLLQHSSGRFGRWVLKCPFTVAHIGAFLDVFPDATVIHVHRDASKALSSVCRLATTLQASFLLRPDLESIGAFWSTYYLDALERSWQFRRAHPSRQIIDVSYSDLVRDPVETAMKLQKPLGLVLDPDLLSAVPGTARHAGDNTEKVIDFGIDDSEIRQRFLAYDLGQPSETRASKAPRQ